MGGFALTSYIRQSMTALIVLVLAGCSGSHGVPAPDPATRDLINQIAATPESLAAFHANTTHRSFSKAHGTQIEYLAPDGRTYLVYPGNTRMVLGEWKSRISPRRGKPAEMCFRYGQNSYNPVTKQRGGSWSCTPGRVYTYLAQEIIPGDPLNMRNTRTLPQVLPGGTNISLATIAKAINRGPIPDTDKVQWSPVQGNF